MATDAGMEAPFGEDPPVLYCPMCGRQIIAQDKEGIITFLFKLGYDESMLVIELGGSGMACGPVSTSVTLGFNLEAGLTGN
jgi:hypothetical protein